MDMIAVAIAGWGINVSVHRGSTAQQYHTAYGLDPGQGMHEIIAFAWPNVAEDSVRFGRGHSQNDSNFG